MAGCYIAQDKGGGWYADVGNVIMAHDPTTTREQALDWAFHRLRHLAWAHDEVCPLGDPRLLPAKRQRALEQVAQAARALATAVDEGDLYPRIAVPMIELRALLTALARLDALVPAPLAGLGAAVDAAEAARPAWHTTATAKEAR